MKNNRFLVLCLSWFFCFGLQINGWAQTDSLPDAKPLLWQGLHGKIMHDIGFYRSDVHHKSGSAELINAFSLRRQFGLGVEFYVHPSHFARLQAGLGGFEHRLAFNQADLNVAENYFGDYDMMSYSYFGIGYGSQLNLDQGSTLNVLAKAQFLIGQGVYEEFDIANSFRYTLTESVFSQSLRPEFGLEIGLKNQFGGGQVLNLFAGLDYSLKPFEYDYRIVNDRGEGSFKSNALNFRLGCSYDLTFERARNRYQKKISSKSPDYFKRYRQHKTWSLMVGVLGGFVYDYMGQNTSTIFLNKVRFETGGAELSLSLQLPHQMFLEGRYGLSPLETYYTVFVFSSDIIQGGSFGLGYRLESKTNREIFHFSAGGSLQTINRLTAEQFESTGGKPYSEGGFINGNDTVLYIRSYQPHWNSLGYYVQVGRNFQVARNWFICADFRKTFHSKAMFTYEIETNGALTGLTPGETTFKRSLSMHTVFLGVKYRFNTKKGG